MSRAKAALETRETVRKERTARSLFMGYIFDITRFTKLFEYDLASLSMDSAHEVGVALAHREKGFVLREVLLVVFLKDGDRLPDAADRDP